MIDKHKINKTTPDNLLSKQPQSDGCNRIGSFRDMAVQRQVCPVSVGDWLKNV